MPEQTIYLGPSGSEVLLPTIKWIGNPPNTTVNASKQLLVSKMSDGSRRYGILPIKLEYSLSWSGLTEAELSILKTLNGYEQALNCQNTWIDSNWRTMMIVSFRHAPLLSISAEGAVWYQAEMTLEEV